MPLSPSLKRTIQLRLDVTESQWARLWTNSKTCTIFPFLRLPGELRNQVYRYLLLSIAGPIPHPDCRTPDNTRLFPTSVISILLLNRRIHHEAASILYGENEFQFKIAPYRNAAGVVTVKLIAIPFLNRYAPLLRFFDIEIERDNRSLHHYHNWDMNNYELVKLFQQIASLLYSWLKGRDIEKLTIHFCRPTGWRRTISTLQDLDLAIMIEREAIEPLTHLRNIKKVLLFGLDQGTGLAKNREQMKYEQYVVEIMQSGKNEPHRFYNLQVYEAMYIATAWMSDRHKRKEALGEGWSQRLRVVEAITDTGSPLSAFKSCRKRDSPLRHRSLF